MWIGGGPIRSPTSFRHALVARKGFCIGNNSTVWQVMKRFFEMVEHMRKSDGMQRSGTHQEPLGFIVKRVCDKFVDKSVDECLTRCRDDLTVLTRFVNWNFHERSAGALRCSLPGSSMVQFRSTPSHAAQGGQQQPQGPQMKRRWNRSVRPPVDGAVFDQWEAANTGGLGGAGSVTRQKRTAFNLQQLMEEASSSRGRGPHLGRSVSTSRSAGGNALPVPSP